MPAGYNWILLVGGGHSSGKKTLSDNVKTNLEALSTSSYDCPISVSVVCLDDITKDHIGEAKCYNPKGYDFDKMREHLASLGARQTLPKVLIAYGKYALYDEKLRAMADMKVFIHGDPDVRLSRWILRDTGGDSSKLEPILNNYLANCRPEMEKYILPTRQYADVILPDAAKEYTDSSVGLLAIGIYDLLKEAVLADTDFRLDVTLLTSPTGTPNLGPKVPNLRVEKLDSDIQRYYELS